MDWISSIFGKSFEGKRSGRRAKAKSNQETGEDEENVSDGWITLEKEELRLRDQPLEEQDGKDYRMSALKQTNSEYRYDEEKVIAEEDPPPLFGEARAAALVGSTLVPFAGIPPLAEYLTTPQEEDEKLPSPPTRKSQTRKKRDKSKKQNNHSDDSHGHSPSGKGRREGTKKSGPRSISSSPIPSNSSRFSSPTSSGVASQLSSSPLRSDGSRLPINRRDPHPPVRNLYFAKM